MLEVIYFELNNWHGGTNFPLNMRFLDWMNHYNFRNEEWVKKNKLCVVVTTVDLSLNYCVTATREWVEDNCYELLETYTEFLREPDEYGDVYSTLTDIPFLKYSEENIGVHWVEMQDD